MTPLEQQAIALDNVYKETSECENCCPGSSCAMHTEKLWACIDEIRKIGKSLAAKPETFPGHGVCPDCTWHDDPEVCNVDRDSKQCKLNKRPK